MIVLDTNVISELMRSRPNPRVLQWVDQQDEATLFVATVTLAEIRFGIAMLPQGQRRAALDANFENEIRPMFGDRVLDFDESASRAYAAIRAAGARAGSAIGLADALIASVAYARRFLVATRDTSPFLVAGLQVINPFAD